MWSKPRLWRRTKREAAEAALWQQIQHASAWARLQKRLFDIHHICAQAGGIHCRSIFPKDQTVVFFFTSLSFSFLLVLCWCFHVGWQEYTQHLKTFSGNAALLQMWDEEVLQDKVPLSLYDFRSAEAVRGRRCGSFVWSAGEHENMNETWWDSGESFLGVTE